MKICTVCNQIKELGSFYKDKRKSDGLQMECKSCNSARTRAYFRTKAGLLTQIYGSQRSNSKPRGHQPPAYTKDKLQVWMLEQDIFHKLYKKWKKSGYKKMLSPSVDRLDDSKGYSFDNIQLLSWQQNKDKGYESREVPVIQFNAEGNEIRHFKSAAKAAKEVGCHSGDITKCCNGKASTAGASYWGYA